MLRDFPLFNGQVRSSPELHPSTGPLARASRKTSIQNTDTPRHPHNHPFATWTTFFYLDPHQDHLTASTGRVSVPVMNIIAKKLDRYFIYS